MKRESVSKLIDKRIIDGYVDGFGTMLLIQELKVRSESQIRANIKDDDIAAKIDLITDDDLGAIDSTRMKYAIFYVQHCRKRMKDLEWIKANKYKFKQYSHSQVFKLIQLKDKLKIDVSLPALKEWYLNEHPLTF
jgi:hypothetical protein